MDNPIIRAGHRFLGLRYLILAEDGAHPACDDPELPADVFRLTIATGRQIDLRDGPADEMRRHLVEAGRDPSPGYSVGRQVMESSSGPGAGDPRRRRRRKAE